MSFSNDIRRFNQAAVERYKSVYRNSVQELGRTANTPQAQGGRLNVDTGFMRNSQAYALNQMPSGPSQNETNSPVNDRMGDGPILILGRWQPGDTVYIGYTAFYSRHQEYQTGFVRSAAQQWDDIVERNTRAAR